MCVCVCVCVDLSCVGNSFHLFISLFDWVSGFCTYNGIIIAASGGLRTRMLKPIEEAGNGATVEAVCVAYVVLSIVIQRSSCLEFL